MTLVLEPPIRWWRCPSCNLIDRTQRADIHTQMHPCPAMNGINIPLVEVSDHDGIPNAHNIIVEREDYGTDRIAAIRTERADGSNDCTVIPSTAEITIGN